MARKRIKYKSDRFLHLRLTPKYDPLVDEVLYTLSSSSPIGGRDSFYFYDVSRLFEFIATLKKLKYSFVLDSGFLFI